MVLGEKMSDIIIEQELEEQVEFEDLDCFLIT